MNFFAMGGPLLVRLQIGHTSSRIDPAMHNGHTHRWTVFVRSEDGKEFKDRSFVEKVEFQTVTCSTRQIKYPPFLASDTAKPRVSRLSDPLAAFWRASPIWIWIGGKKYDASYFLTFTLDESASRVATTTFYVSETSPGLYSTAKRFGADNVVRRGEEKFIGLPGLVCCPSLNSIAIVSSQAKLLQIRNDFFPLLELPRELISHVFSFLTIKDRMNARVNKKLNEIELESKYFVDSLVINERSVNRPNDNDPRDQVIQFYEEKVYSPDCIRRIAQNATIGWLLVSLTGSDDFHRDVFAAIKGMDIGILVMSDMSETLTNEIMVDSFFLHLASKCKELNCGELGSSDTTCDNISAEALHQVYKNMMDESTRLEELSINLKRNRCIAFLNLIGIFYRNNQFTSSRNIEVYCEEEPRLEFSFFQIFDGFIQVSFGKFDDDEDDEQASIFLQHHKNQESLDKAKKEGGYVVRIA